MSTNDVQRDRLIKDDIRARLVTDLNATDDELEYIENLLKIQKEKCKNQNQSGRLPSIVIDEFLYHGDLGHAIDLDLLLDLKIQHIINVCDCPLDEQIQQMFHVLWIADLEDSFQGNIRRCFDRTNEFLYECRMKNEKVLVHCQAGISRSSAIVLAYLIKHDQLSLEKAFDYLLDRRPMASPNYSFLLQLIRYEKEINSLKVHR